MWEHVWKPAALSQNPQSRRHETALTMTTGEKTFSTLHDCRRIPELARLLL
jgi:hypothetical protein